MKATMLPKARGLFRGPAMNGTEKAWSERLTILTAEGVLRHWRFEAITLKLGHDCRYTPDFYALTAEGVITFYEVKGFWRDDARVKIKVAASKFPEFQFVAVQRKKGHWETEVIQP